jgi:flagellar protein FlaG
VRRNLNFSLEEASGRVVVKVVDAGSGDLIRQIPSEEALQLAESLSDVRSLLFKAEA